MPVLDTIVVEVIERGPQGPQVSDGDKGDITVSSNGTNWQINAGAVGTTELADEAVTTAKIDDDAVTNTKLADMPEGTVKLRPLGVGVGSPQDGTPAQVKAISGVFDTIADLAAAEIPTPMVTVTTLGYHTVGIGACRRVRRASAGPGRVPSADGAYWEVAEDWWTPQMCGAVGDGATNDTAAFRALAGAQAPQILIPKGNYRIDPIDWQHRVTINLTPQAVIEQRTTGVVGPTYAAPTYTVTRQALFQFNHPGSAGSYVFGGGWFDGRRSSITGFIDEYQSKWGAIDATAPDVTVENLYARNFNSHAFNIEGDRAKAFNLTSVSCGQGTLIGRFAATGDTSADGPQNQTVMGIYDIDGGNASANVFQHGIDVWFSHRSNISGLVVHNIGGDAGGKSSTVTAITILGCHDTVVSGAIAPKWNTSLPRLAISCVGNVNCTFDGLITRGSTSIGIEDISNQNCTFANYLVDGEYLNNTTSVGVNFNVGSQYAISGRGRRRSISGSRSRHVNGIVMRCNWGYYFRGQMAELVGCTTKGNLSHGVVITDWEANDANLGQVADSRAEPLIINGLISYNNHGAGITLYAFGKVIWSSGACYNNGQNSANSEANRSGVSLFPSETSDYFHMVDVEAYDDQGETLTAAVTFKPASSVNNRISITVMKPHKLDYGQYVTIKNGGGPGSDITGYIYDYLQDDFVLQLSGSATLSATGNTTNLSGTWTTDGTDNTRLNGSGGAASTEIDGHLWVTNGTEWRQVIASSGNNILFIDQPFSAALSGATLTALRCNLATIKSQQVGHRLSVTNLTSMYVRGCEARGNVIRDWVVSDPTKFAVGSEYVFETVNTGVATTFGPTALVTTVPAGHAIDGVAAHVVTTISGGGVTSWDLAIQSSAGSDLEVIATGLALAQNTKLNRGVQTPVRNDTTTRRLAAKFTGGTPTAGAIRAKMRCRAARAEAYADV